MALSLVANIGTMGLLVLVNIYGLFANINSLAVLVFGNYNFVPVEQTLGSNVLSCKYQHALFLSEVISRPVVY